MEGGVSIVFVTLIVLLTGGGASPFFFAFVLIVVGAALVVPPTATVSLVVLASASYLVAIALELTPGSADVGLIAVVGVNLVSLVLLAYVAMVVAREQRRTRLAAVRLSTTDALTGLANRAYIIAAIEREIERGTRYGRGFCLLMADLDNLKEINDSYGHRAGDHVLAGVADVIRDGVRRIDTSARLGGDEFVVLLPETDPTGAFVVAEKIRQGVAAMRTIERDGPVPVSVSIGLVAWPDDGGNPRPADRCGRRGHVCGEAARPEPDRGPYAAPGEMTPVILPASPAAERRMPVSLGREMGRAGWKRGPRVLRARGTGAAGRRCTIRRWDDGSTTRAHRGGDTGSARGSAALVGPGLHHKTDACRPRHVRGRIRRHRTDPPRPPDPWPRRAPLPDGAPAILARRPTNPVASLGRGVYAPPGITTSVRFAVVQIVAIALRRGRDHPLHPAPSIAARSAADYVEQMDKDPGTLEPSLGAGAVAFLERLQLLPRLQRVVVHAPAGPARRLHRRLHPGPDCRALAPVAPVRSASRTPSTTRACPTAP